MAGASLFFFVAGDCSGCGFRNPVQKYSKKKRPTKMGLIFGQIRTNFRTNCCKSVICPRTLSDNYCFVRRLRAFVKSSPHKMNLGEANGLMSSAFRSSVTLLNTT